VAALTTVVLLVSMDPGQRRLGHGWQSEARADGGGWLPPRCERQHDGLYENRDPALIAKIGERYVLTFRCEGMHQIYVRRPATVNLGAFVGRAVCARYRYLDEANLHTVCVRAPCPPARERVVDIDALTEAAEGIRCPS